MAKVVTFGEIMLRLSPPGFERLLQSPVLQATFGGGEANVAVSLARFGLESWYCTRVPKNGLGDAVVRALRAEGVRTEAIIRGGDRIGDLLHRSRRQPAAVHRHLRPRAIGDQRARSLPRWTGHGLWTAPPGCMSPASRRRSARRAVACTRAVIDAARKAGSRVSIDLNFRKKLWTEVQAQAVMRELVRDIDVVIANEEDLQSTLGIEVEGTDVTSGELAVDSYREAARVVSATFNVKHGRHHPAREPLGERQRLERRAVGPERAVLHHRPALRRSAGRSHRWRRLALRPA